MIIATYTTANYDLAIIVGYLAGNAKIKISLNYKGSLWFTGRILFYLLISGFYHIGIRKDHNNMAYK